MRISNEFKSLVLGFIAYFTFYYNRKCVSLVFPQLIKEGLTQQNAGTILSAQSISMAIITFTAGILSDRFAAKHLMCFGLSVCSISTLLFSNASNITQYSIFWFCNGLGQGFSLPSILKLTKDNSHSTRFATNWSIVLISVNFAGILNPFISAFITQTYHWRTSLAISAYVTLTIGFLCLILLETPNTNSKTLNNNKKSVEEKDKSENSELKTLDLLKYPFLWICIISRFIVAVTRISVTDWSQIYLINERHIDLYLSSSFISIVEIGGIFGKLIAGRVSDLLMRRALKRSNDSSVKLMARLPVSVVMLTLNALALHLYCFHINQNSSLILFTICALLIGINTSGNVVNLSVIATEINPKKAGLCSSLVNLSAKVGGIFTGLPLSLIANYYSWNIAFILIETFCIFCVCLQILIPRLTPKLKSE